MTIRCAFTIAVKRPSVQAAALGELPQPRRNQRADPGPRRRSFVRRVEAIGFGDTNQYGMAGVRFWTKVKTVTQRWPDGGAGDSAFVIPTMA